jgi:hypothetical protein
VVVETAETQDAMIVAAMSVIHQPVKVAAACFKI